MICAALLAQRGLKVVVVEQHPQRYHLSRAGHFDSEIMRIFQRLGIASKMELRSQANLPYELRTAELETLQKVTTGQSCSGWQQSYHCPSREIENIVNTRALELGVKVYMGVTAVAFTEENNRAQLMVRPTKSSEEETTTIDAAYVIGADGANSFLRDAIKSQRLDLGFKPVENLLVDVEHNDPDRDIPGLPYNLQILDVRRPRLAGRWGGTNWSRFEFTLLEGDTHEHFEAESTAWEFLKKWNITPEDAKIVRRSFWTLDSTIADKWRVGRALLAGDSVHTMLPFMGQGMCSGLRDAMNLSWKLDAVIKGEANSNLLDTYQLEREQHVRTFIDMAMSVGRVALVTDPEAARRRDEMLRAGTGPRPPAFPKLVDGILPAKENRLGVEGRPSLQARVALKDKIDRLDEFLEPGWVLVSRHKVIHNIFDSRQENLISVIKLQFAHVSRGVWSESDSFRDVDGEYDNWFIETGCNAFLQRPDNYIFGAAKTIDEIPALLNELGTCLTANGYHDLQY